MVDAQHASGSGPLSLQGALGYLNFSTGKPDARFQKQLNDAWAVLAAEGAAEPWTALHQRLRAELAALKAAGAAAFREATQVEAVLPLLFTHVLPAYRAHHADLLGHLSERDLFQPFFVARVAEAVLAQGSPWDETERIVRGALVQLNDFVGYRPIAILETRPRGEPYDHERVRPIPLYLRGAGVACSRYHDLLARTLDILQATDPALLTDAHFDLQLLDELALDPRAFDHGHPVNRRPNYIFGEWDPHHLDQQSRYRRFVVRQAVLDGLLERVEQPGSLDRSELLFEAAAVLAGTILMAAGTSGGSPSAHDSSATLTSLMPGIARYREAFYQNLLTRVPAPHQARLREEAATTRQPFGAARQHLNQFISRQRAVQVQQRYLALIFAEMGYPEASRREAAQIPVVAVRLLSDILSRLGTGQLHLDRGELTAAARLLPEVEDLLQRGIACGAFVDPWNALGFQGMFPLSPAREESVRDPRIDELLLLMQQIFGYYARLLSEAAAAGEKDLLPGLTRSMQKLATWWDRFATVEVGEVRRVHGGEAAASAEHVATALARWRQRGEATADLGFWRQHLEGFRSPKAFALVVDALLRKQDYPASLALLMNWLGQAEQVPLEEGEHSFHTLALRWMLAVTSAEPAGAGSVWPRVQKFFDFLEANADDYWQVPAIGPELLPMPREADDAEDLYSAAYEDVTYRDSTGTGDDQEGAVADGGPLRDNFLLESNGDEIGRRLRFLSTLARLWMLAARQDPRLPDAAGRTEALLSWLAAAREKQQKLLALLDEMQGCRVPEPLGSHDSLIEYDRRRMLKEQLLYSAINTCLDVSLAVGSLHAAAATAPGEAEAGRPTWEAWAVRLEQSFLRGDAAEARAALPHFLETFRDEPLLFVPLAEGGEPRYILRSRTAQTILRALVATLPRLGLLRETFHLLKAAWHMEQSHRVGGRGVTEFNQLFQTGYQAVLESAIDSADTWRRPVPGGEESISDEELVHLLEALTTPFLSLWVQHSRTMQLSGLESVGGDEEWQLLVEFIQRYGHDLFHTRFMTLGNLRGILHRGIGAYLDYLRDNPDPLHPVKLIDDLENGLPREQVVRRLQFVLQAVVENYEEYRDYNTTVARSDYGENLHLLLDFLRLKASYERHAWQLRPLVLAHEVLAYRGWANAAILWEEGVSRSTRELAANHLEALAGLERSHGMRLGTVADRLKERFVQPLALDRLCALIEPAMEEARQAGPTPEFDRLREELQVYAATPTGVGLDVPPWLRQLEAEVQRVRAAHTSLAELAEGLFQMPERLLSFEEMQQQLQEWEKPLN
jgi:hypothetical protein